MVPFFQMVTFPEHTRLLKAKILAREHLLLACRRKRVPTIPTLKVGVGFETIAPVVLTTDPTTPPHT